MQHLCNELLKYNTLPNKYLKSHLNPKLDISEYECSDKVKKQMYKLKHSVEYHGVIQSSKIRIRFFTIVKEDCIHHYQIIMTILRFMLHYNPIPIINIDILFTDVKKILPDKGIIGQDTLNTGYTIGNTIVVYREEEWLKVFIHECMHLFGYDLILRNKSELIYTIFPVNNHIQLNESYCEIWARILNCCIISIVNDIPVKKLVDKESEFSLNQMVKILDYMNLSYSDLFNPKIKFHENTNTFAYIVIAGILMTDPYYFVEWCSIHNSPFIRITDENEYVKLIKMKCKLPIFLKPKKIKYTSNSTVMTINNIHL
jgi:hypothetical protein